MLGSLVERLLGPLVFNVCVKVFKPRRSLLAPGLEQWQSKEHPELGKLGAKETQPTGRCQHNQELQPWGGNLVTGIWGSSISCIQCQ